MPIDSLKREIRDLRISVTDRCNFRCLYCMPQEKYDWIDRREILSFEELARLVRVFLRLGVDRVRLTGGEPLLRRDLHRLVGQLSSLPGLRDLSLTTNGALLAAQAAGLAAAGLRRINVSLDSLDSDKFREITRRNDLHRVLEGIFAARRHGITPVKLNCVVERGVNDDEILPLVDFARANDFPIRFIEFMDVGNVNDWKSERMVPKEEILRVIRSKYALHEAGRGEGSAPAVEYRFADTGGEIGIVASVTEPFCGSCTRARLTADGRLVTCLFSAQGHDLKGMIRGGASDQRISETVRNVWEVRSDRYSEQRLEALRSAEGYRPGTRKKIEMISLGG